MRTRITRGSANKGTAEKTYEIPRRNFGKRYGEFAEKSEKKCVLLELV